MTAAQLDIRTEENGANSASSAADNATKPIDNGSALSPPHDSGGGGEPEHQPQQQLSMVNKKLLQQRKVLIHLQRQRLLQSRKSMSEDDALTLKVTINTVFPRFLDAS